MPQRQRAAYMKEWRANNKEKIVATSKEYCANNKEEMAAYHKEWCQTLAGIKSRIITVWKRYGITPPEGYTMHELYDEIYMPCTNCMVCNKLFKNSKDKCADHDHDIVEHNFRQVLCHGCNVHDYWKKHSEYV